MLALIFELLFFILGLFAKLTAILAILGDMLKLENLPGIIGGFFVIMLVVGLASSGTESTEQCEQGGLSRRQEKKLRKRARKARENGDLAALAVIMKLLGE